jgi:hypothetical protein
MADRMRAEAIEVKTRHLISYPQEIADLIPRAAGTSG